MKLVIGTKTYSSWSLRPWIALVAAGIPFEEEIIPLYQPDTTARIVAASPNARVPLLIDGAVTVWESLAILEYVADQFPHAGLWPFEPAARAHARAIANEMHAGFAPLRQHCPMNIRRRPRPRPSTPDDVKANVARIDAIWTSTRERFGAGGPFLFGERFGNADAMYAPVVSRLHTYAQPVSPGARAYMEAVMATPAWQRWHDEARAEPDHWIRASYDAD
jgi:glutathione S-transferase